MKTLGFRATSVALVAFAMLPLASPLRAQQGVNSAPAQQAPAPRALQPAQLQSGPTLPRETQPAPEQQLPVLGEAPVAGDGAARPASVGDRAAGDLSPWSMFRSADILVKAVIISLAFASLATWTIFLAKTVQLALARRRLSEALARISRCRTLSEAQSALGATTNVLSPLLAAAVHELQMSADSVVDSGIKERSASSFSEIARTEARAVRHGMGVLATIGSTAPFVGLFGTVWGIMNSFIGISKAQTTNLAVVAPGIAEALLATAVGLVAAIPAVIIYNHFSRATKSYLDLVGRASGTVGRLLSRDLDRMRSITLSRAAE
jgi:biopolymer transport protein ExbB